MKHVCEYCGEILNESGVLIEGSDQAIYNSESDSFTVDFYNYESKCPNCFDTVDVNVVETEKNTKDNLTLLQCDNELVELLKKVECTDDMEVLGFECRSMLCEYAGYENFYERLWACVKTYDDSTINTVVICDVGNGYCSVAYRDMYIKELMNK